MNFHCYMDDSCRQTPKVPSLCTECAGILWSPFLSSTESVFSLVQCQRQQRKQTNVRQLIGIINHISFYSGVGKAFNQPLAISLNLNQLQTISSDVGCGRDKKLLLHEGVLCYCCFIEWSILIISFPLEN